MPLIKPEMKEQIRTATRHPVQWMRGDGLPEESIRPWEMAVQIVPKFFSGLRNGFTMNAMYLFQNVFGVNKRQQSVATVTYSVIGGLSDPVIGSFMDAKPYSVNTHRWVMRAQAVVATITRLLPMFDFGLTPWRRVGLYIFLSLFRNIVATASGVSGTKVFAHITPAPPSAQSWSPPMA